MNNYKQNIIDFDLPQNLDEIVDGVDIVQIDLEGIGNESKQTATDMINNLTKLYHNEDFMAKHPDFKKRIDAELESLRVLIKMRKADEVIQDTLVKSISANSGNASLYRALSEIQKTILAITTKIEDVVKSLNGMMKGFQLEFEFPQKEQDENSEEIITDNGVFRGSKDFISQMLCEDEEEN